MAEDNTRWNKHDLVTFIVRQQQFIKAVTAAGRELNLRVEATYTVFPDRNPKSNTTSMKVLIFGATGTIGSAILEHCLQTPSITSIVALSRRPLPENVSSPKLTTIIHSNFAEYDDALLSQIVSAGAAIWALGDTSANRDVNYVYPHAFFTAFMNKRKGSEPSRNRFRYVRVCGAFTERDQDRSLWFYAEARKLHGLSEAKSLELGEQYRDTCQTFIVKPGGVSTKKSWALHCVGSMLGDGLAISDEELGAFVADLVVHGEEEEGAIFNRRMVEKGRLLLKEGSRG